VARTDLIGRYLEELAKGLGSRADADEVLSEVEDHLRSVAEAHVTLGLTHDDAVRHALGTFGSAELVTRAFASSRKGGAAMPTQLTKVSGAAAMLGGIALAVALALASVRPWDLGATTGWFAPLLGAALVLVFTGLIGTHLRHRAVYTTAGRTGRWLVPLGALGTAVSVVLWAVVAGIVFEVVVLAGLALIGADVWRAGVIDRRAIGLTAAALPATVLLPLLGSDGWLVAPSVLGFTGLGAGLAWIGHGLWRESSVDGAPGPTVA
jgi:hypothetical protein